MAVDMFLKIEGLDGESADDVHADEIDILAWSWGLSQSGTMHMGKGGGSGKVSVQDISITKWIDSSSHDLVRKCCNGAHFEKAILTVRKAGEDPLEYLVITMKEIIVTSVSTGGSGGEDQLTENVSLNFKEFEVVYTPQEKDGSGGAAKDFAWNIATNAVV
jgi:type VI secretion system secreted protein Hcp